MKRREFITMVVGAAAPWPLTAYAQQAGKNPTTSAQIQKIGWLKIQDKTHTPGQLKSFLTGLQALGQVEGHTFSLETRYADGDGGKLQSLAEDLLRVGVNVIVATSQPSLDAAYLVTRSVPIVSRMIDDPERTGKAQSLAHPGGNVTGVYTLVEDMSTKRLELLHQTMPSARKVGALLTLSRGATSRWLEETRHAAQAMGLEIHVMDVNSGNDLEPAFDRASRAGVEALLVLRNPTVVTFDRRVAELASMFRMPSIFDARDYVEAGGLMSYGPDLDVAYRRLASIVDAILKGIRPGDIPIEQPTTVELAINLKTAKALGIVIPPTLLATAEAVIE
jgi:putative tryptophan/tyrosine transport system substrate-binding protein